MQHWVLHHWLRSLCVHGLRIRVLFHLRFSLRRPALWRQMLSLLHLLQDVVRRRGQLRGVGGPPGLHPVPRRVRLRPDLRHERHHPGRPLDGPQRHRRGRHLRVERRVRLRLPQLGQRRAQQRWHWREPGLRGGVGEAGWSVGRRLLLINALLPLLQSNDHLQPVLRWILHLRPRLRQLYHLHFWNLHLWIRHLGLRKLQLWSVCRGAWPFLVRKVRSRLLRSGHRSLCLHGLRSRVLSRLPRLSIE
mmetsp:Transcript_52735/g.138676  ORF Transcript_52735/g.138676 Transcript_52735/m.138676 type:complete len:247 (-) Transcript_52735:62-802(-)